MKNQVSEKRLKLNKELAKHFRIARATTGLSRKEVVGALDDIPNYNTLFILENPSARPQKTIALLQAESILNFYEKYGYRRTAEMNVILSQNSFVEKNSRKISNHLRKKLKADREIAQREEMRKAASEVLSKVSLTPNQGNEPTVPTEDRFLREKVASLATDVSHIKKMINMIAKDLGLEK